MLIKIDTCVNRNLLYWLWNVGHCGRAKRSQIDLVARLDQNPVMQVA